MDRAARRRRVPALAGRVRDKDKDRADRESWSALHVPDKAWSRKWSNNGWNGTTMTMLARRIFSRLRRKTGNLLASQTRNPWPESFGHDQAVEFLGSGPYLLRAECWTFDWNIGFIRDQMNPTLYFTIINPANGKSRRLKYTVDTVGYGLKFSHLGLVFGYRSEFSTFGSSVMKSGEVTVKINSIPKVIRILPCGSKEFSIIGTNTTWWTLEAEGTRIGSLTRVGTQYLGAGPLLGYMVFREVHPTNLSYSPQPPLPH
jgi:hypothetical protein